MSPIEIQTSVCALFSLCVGFSVLFLGYKYFAWKSPKYQTDPFINAWTWAICAWSGRKKFH
ncbi:MAG: hypothetical protein ACPK85_09350 [Methanosarcina sp.]